MKLNIKNIVIIAAILVLGSSLALAGTANQNGKAPFAVAERALKLINETNSAKLNSGQVINLLENGSQRIRRQAAYILGEWGDERAVQPLLASLKDSDAVLRRVAASALGKLQSQAAVENLIQVAVAAEEPASVRCAAVNALGRIGDPRALGHLIELARCNDRSICFAATTALERVENGNYN